MQILNYTEEMPGRLSLNNKKKKVGILGGTFNPPHLGHLEIMKEVRDEYGLDLVLILPVGQPPHKRNSFVAAKEHRADMVSLMAEEYDFIEPCLIEVYRDGYTYTVDTMRELRKFMNDVDFYYIIGTDTLFQLTTWKNFEEIFRLTEFICVYRPGDDADEVLKRADYLTEEFGASIHMSVNSGPDISSTEVREIIMSGGDASEFLTEKVWRYLEENNVYKP